MCVVISVYTGHGPVSGIADKRLASYPLIGIAVPPPPPPGGIGMSGRKLKLPSYSARVSAHCPLTSV